MESTFIYSHCVSGSSYLQRRREKNIFCNLLSAGENIVIASPPKTGKTSFVQQCLLSLGSAGSDLLVARLDLTNIRERDDFFLELGSCLIGAAYKTLDEYDRAIKGLLADTHLVFDKEQFRLTGRILSLNWDLDEGDINSIFTLPYKIGRERGKRLVLVLEEFQNVLLLPGEDRTLRLLDGVFRGLSTEQKAWASYVFTGSKLNAMEDIFHYRHLFVRLVEKVELGEIETREIIDYINKGFQLSGKVIDRELLLGVCKLFRGHLFYINLFASICDSLTRGYVMEPILNAALDTVISIFEPQFKATMDDLTLFQVRLLRAIVDGHTKFTSSDVIESYNLNSSANVHRLREALCKKEIVFFHEDGTPKIIDPLFEYWVKSKYFKINI